MTWKLLVAICTEKEVQGGALVAGVSNVKQEVPVQVKKERAVTVVCSHGHDLVRIPVPPKQTFCLVATSSP